MGSVDQSLQTLTQKLGLVSRYYVLRRLGDRSKWRRKAEAFLARSIDRNPRRPVTEGPHRWAPVPGLNNPSSSTGWRGLSPSSTPGRSDAPHVPLTRLSFFLPPSLPSLHFLSSIYLSIYHLSIYLSSSLSSPFSVPFSFLFWAPLGLARGPSRQGFEGAKN